VTPVQIHEVMALLGAAVQQWPSPAVTIVSQREGNPFKVLISCILSLRTHDRVTGPASERLFARAATPELLAVMPEDQIAQLIYPVGFYRVKAGQIKAIANRLATEFAGRVPDDLNTLLTFTGVGRKTANLVLTLGFRKPGICVDTHVHRICNRWGYVVTRTPAQTETALRAILPADYWLTINDQLVSFGQHLCTPLSPHCSRCTLISFCNRCGISRFR
jgi:endonuclease III